MPSITGLTSLVPTLGAAVFAPTDIAGLQLWLDANDAATLFQDAAKTTPAGDTDVVGAWADKSGNGNDALQSTTAAKPTRQDGIINGLPVVRGDGGDDEMVINVTTTNETVFIVSSHVVNNAFGTIISVSGTHRVLYSTVANSVQYFYNNQTAIKTGGFVETDPNIFRAKYDGANNKVAVNNGVEGSAAPVGFSHTWLRIFSRPGPLNLLLGDIAEVCLYNSGLSVSNVALVEAYLSNKWGITIA